MASVARDPNGTKRVLFTDGDGERRAVRLGKVSAKAAESFRLRVEALLSAKELNQSPDAELSAWLRDLPERMHTRLVRVGLVEPREGETVVTLGAMLDRFDAAAVVKAGTRTTYRQALAMMRKHLGEARDIRAITPADADSWRRTLADSGLAPATVAKRIKVAKAVFRLALRWGLVASNPYADLRAGSQSNPDRAFYVSQESIRAILAACPDDEWRAVIALSRYAGLRCPSEIITLRWADVNWERRRLTVRSPKTAGYEGHAVRVVPIAAELLPILQDIFDRAEPGEEAVLPRLRDPRLNLRTQFGRIIAKAGEKPWPRLFHNMRASCATDWVERFPSHAVASWLGHSPLIAAQHYLQVRDAHFDLAAGVRPAPMASKTSDPKSGAKSGAPVAQKAAQHATAPACAGPGESSQIPGFLGVSRASASEREASANRRNDPDGIRTHVPTVKGWCPRPG